jgi:tetratricopeptide (TPR) repeat protein
MQKIFLFLVVISAITISKATTPVKDLLQSISDKAQDYLQNGKIDQAIKEYEHYLKAHPNCHETKTYLAALYGTIGNSKKEFEFCNSAIKSKPDYPGVYINLGNAFTRKGQTLEAEKNYLKAFSLAKKDYTFAAAGAAYSLSNFYMDNPNFPKVIEWANICLEYCAQMIPNDKHTKLQHLELIRNATLNKAGAYANQKNFKTAILIVKEFVEKNPYDMNAHQMLAELNNHQQLITAK